MKQKLFNTKKLEPKCIYCAIGAPSPDGESVVCVKYGVMLPTSHCHSFIYDALKRTPTPKAKLPEFSQEDFSLELPESD